MKTLICLLACWLAAVGARAEDTMEAPRRDICAPRLAGMPLSAPLEKATVASIEVAIDKLDNTKVDQPSPNLAGGVINYIDISPNFVERIENVCVLGVFELDRGNNPKQIPLQIDHIEIIKSAQAQETNQTATRIYFYTPTIREFHVPADRWGIWKFWNRYQLLHLKIAAFDYQDGQRGKTFFGRDVDITVSDKRSSVLAATLFAAFFYLIAAVAMSSRQADKADPAAAGWRGAVNRAMPWNIIGSNGQECLSQLQMLLFTMIVATLLFYQWLRTGLLQEISTDLLYLIGISTVGAAGTQITTSLKKDLDPKTYQYVQQLGWFAAPIAVGRERVGVAELLMTNQRFDIYKFQMLVFTCVIAAYVIASGANELAHIQISATLLALMGISQGAYVGGRATADNLTPLQDLLLSMQNLQERYQASDDPQVGGELRRRFALAAGQAGAMFNQIFGRALPAYLLEMPIDAKQAAPAAPQPADA